MFELWDRVLVTGAAGFVGQHVLRELHKVHPEAKIWGTYLGGKTLPASLLQQGIDWVDLDIRDEVAVNGLVSSIKPTAIIHLAAIAAPQNAQENTKLAWDVNFLGAMNIANAMMLYTPRSRLIFVSTSEVYGLSFIGLNRSIDEQVRLQPANVYGATKAAADIALRQMACDGLDLVCFRPFNHTGPGQTEDFVAGAFAKQVAEMKLGHREPVLHVGNTDAMRDFMDVRDVVRAYVLALKPLDLDLQSRVLNLASARAVKIHTIIDTLRDISSINFEIKIDQSRVRPTKVPVITGDATHARNKLGWVCEIDFTATINDLFDWWCQKLMS